MPRSTKAATRASTSSRRAPKRNASMQSAVYAIPESPQSSTPYLSSSEAATSPCSSLMSSPAASVKSNNAKREELVDKHEDHDATPTQNRMLGSGTVPLESKHFQLPGFEALEAVNGLYQKISHNQVEIERFKEENRCLTQDIQARDQQIRTLQVEIKSYSEKLNAIQQAQGKGSQERCKIAEEKLDLVLRCLRKFSSAAGNLIPLLDALTDNAEIECDETAESLYHILKEHSQKNVGADRSRAKQL